MVTSQWAWKARLGRAGGGRQPRRRELPWCISIGGLVGYDAQFAPEGVSCCPRGDGGTERQQRLTRMRTLQAQEV